MTIDAPSEVDRLRAEEDALIFAASRLFDEARVVQARRILAEKQEARQRQRELKQARKWLGTVVEVR